MSLGAFMLRKNAVGSQIPANLDSALDSLSVSREKQQKNSVFSDSIAALAHECSRRFEF